MIAAPAGTASRRLAFALAAVAGIVCVAGFAPFGVAGLPVLALAVVIALWTYAPRPRDAARIGFAFGLGLFGAGVPWIYIALETFGGMAAPLAAIATAGLSLALLIAVPATLVSTRVLSLSALSGRMARGPFWLRQAVRWALIVLRSVPELVWALVFVRVVGLGPTAGVLAIALTYGGMLGKVYGEILESGEAHATETLLRNGASRLQAFCYGLLPQNAAELTSYTVYRWECAIRSSVVLGFVGAGGLGQQLDGSMKMFNGGEVLSMLLVFVLLVAMADRISAGLRRSLG